MDGTLVSSLPVIYMCENLISQKYTQTSLTLEDVISKFGPPARTIIRNMTASLPEETQLRAISDYYDCYRSNVPAKGLVFPGISHLLKKIRASGKLLGLFTGVERAMMEFTLDPFDLSRYFHERVTADDISRAKPDPEGVLLAMARLKVRPNESIYIGDSPNDIIAGRGAGAVTGAAIWSPENRGDPTTEHPDYEFRSVKQLSDFLFGKTRKSGQPYFAGKDAGQSIPR
jgi:pyrophosphatase PpaX